MKECFLLILLQQLDLDVAPVRVTAGELDLGPMSHEEVKASIAIDSIGDNKVFLNFVEHGELGFVDDRQIQTFE
ncbi:hypothetical protein D3C86_2148950 [compost metagenome]